jgi:hypothetical protein
LASELLMFVVLVSYTRPGYSEFSHIRVVKITQPFANVTFYTIVENILYIMVARNKKRIG